jgi:carbon monoxide dehydrogenase subunit G
VGSVKANFQLRNELIDVTPKVSLTVVSSGKDNALNSSVRTTQVFGLRDLDGQTEVTINADIRVTGRIATFGGRIIQAKAEQVTVEALENVAILLRERRADSA